MKKKEMERRIEALQNSLGQRTHKIHERLVRLESDLGFSLSYRLSGPDARPEAKRIVSRLEALEGLDAPDYPRQIDGIYARLCRLESDLGLKATDDDKARPKAKRIVNRVKALEGIDAPDAPEQMPHETKAQVLWRWVRCLSGEMHVRTVGCGLVPSRPEDQAYRWRKFAKYLLTCDYADLNECNSAWIFQELVSLGAPLTVKRETNGNPHRADKRSYYSQATDATIDTIRDVRKMAARCRRAYDAEVANVD